MREIIENITKVTYEGNCPTCGREQKSRMYASSVDIDCDNCRQAHKVLSESIILKGAVIESVEHLTGQLYTINIILTNGIHGTLTTGDYSDTIDYTLGDEN